MSRSEIPRWTDNLPSPPERRAEVPRPETEGPVEAAERPAQSSDTGPTTPDKDWRPVPAGAAADANPGQDQPPTSTLADQHLEAAVAPLEGFRQAALGDPSLPPAARQVLGTQVSRADGATLVFSALCGRTARQPDSNTPQVEQAPPEPAEVVKAVRENPKIIPDVIRKVQPLPGDAWDILANASPEDFLRPPQNHEKNSQEARTEVAIRDEDEDTQAERQRDAEKDFFESLRLKRPESDDLQAVQDSETGQLWKLRAKAQEEKVAHMGRYARVLDRFVSPQQHEGGRWTGGRQAVEQQRLGKTRAAYDRCLENGDVEGALQSLRGFLNRQVREFENLQRRADSDTVHRNEQELRLPPGHEERYGQYVRLAWYTRIKYGKDIDSRAGADTALEDDAAKLIALRQRARNTRELAAADNPSAATQRDRSPGISEEELRDKASLLALRRYNALLYKTPADALQQLVGSVLVYFHGDGQHQAAQAYAQNPRDTLLGNPPPITDRGLWNELQASALVYRLESRDDRSRAEEMLGEAYNKLYQRLCGSTPQAGDLVSTSDTDFDSGLDPNEIEDLERMTKQAANVSLADRHTIPPSLAERLKKLGQRAAGFSTDATGKMEENMKRDIEARGATFRRTEYPGDVLVITGQTEEADGAPGTALIASLAGHGVERIDMFGTHPLNNGTVHQLGQTMLKGFYDTLPYPDEQNYRAILVEGSASSLISPSTLLQMVRPNGIATIEVALSPGLAAGTLMCIDPEGYIESEVPRIVERWGRRPEQQNVAEMHQHMLGRSPIYEGYRWALVPSKVCRFIPQSDGTLRFETTHRMPLLNRPPELTLVVFRDKPGGPNDLFCEVRDIVNQSSTTA